MLKVLSLRQPWAWLVVNGLKDIENRQWSSVVRGQILIHASKYPDEECFLQNGVLIPFEPAKRLGVLEQMPLRFEDYPQGGICGMVEITGCVTDHKSPWFFGKYGFTLANAKPLPFVSCKGKVNFFDAEQEWIDQLNAQLPEDEHLSSVINGMLPLRREVLPVQLRTILAPGDIAYKVSDWMALVQVEKLGGLTIFERLSNNSWRRRYDKFADPQSLYTKLVDDRKRGNFNT